MIFNLIGWMRETTHFVCCIQSIEWRRSILFSSFVESKTTKHSMKDSTYLVQSNVSTNCRQICLVLLFAFAFFSSGKFCPSFSIGCSLIQTTYTKIQWKNAFSENSSSINLATVNNREIRHAKKNNNNKLTNTRTMFFSFVDRCTQLYR